MTPQETARVLRVAMRTAVAMLSSGAQTDDVEAAAVAVAAAYGVTGVQASVYFSSISISHDPHDLEAPTTLLHIVRDRTAEFARLAAAASLVRRVRDGGLPIDEAEAALASLEQQPSPYGPVVSFLVPGVSAAASTIVFGGNVLDAAMTLLIALLVQPALSLLDRSTLPPFFRVVFGSAASALLVALIVKLGVPITGGLVLTGSLLRFLPGYALVSGFRDLIDQSMISGSARLAEALLLAAGVAGGTVLGLAVATRFEVYLSIVTVGRAEWGLAVAGVAAFIAVGAFAIRLGVPTGAVAQAAALGGAAWLAFIAVTDAGLLDPSLATLGAAISIGVAGRLLARHDGAPAALWVVPAILPLLPGLQLVQAMLAATDVARVSGLLAAAGAAFLVGTGVASGDILVMAVQRVREQLVTPAVDAVAGGIEVYLVAPVERVVGRSGKEPDRPVDPGSGSPGP